MIRQTRSTPNKRLLEFLELMRENAEHGNIIGAATVILLPKRRFLIEVIGEAERDPVFVRGALQSLNDLLAEMARSRRDVDTTI